MEKIVGYKIMGFPFEGMEHVADLIEFDGPILAHYKDKFSNDYLYYWVDSDEQFNRWLIFNILESRLFLYLQKLLSLEDLFPHDGSNLYCVDIDSGINYQNIWMLYADALPEVYRPEQDSFYHFLAPDYYKEKLQVGTYLETLKENALYFKVEPAYDRYGVTVGIQDVYNVLENVSKSISEFIKYRVKNILSERLDDLNRIRVATDSLSANNRLRICYLNLNSFHVGIAADNLNVQHNAMDPSIANFQNDALVTYKNEVLDNDFSSAADIDILVDKFPDEEARKKIFDPIIKIVNNENITINVTDFTKKFDRKYSRITKLEKENLSPAKPKVLKPLQPDQILMVAYVVADKMDQQQTLFPKDVTNRIIYTKETTSFPFEFEKANLPTGEEISLSRTIDMEGTFDAGIFTIQFDVLNIIVSVSDRKLLTEKFNGEFVKLYLDYLTGDLEYKKFFDTVIS